MPRKTAGQGLEAGMPRLGAFTPTRAPRVAGVRASRSPPTDGRLAGLGLVLLQQQPQKV